jgi:hypothetical protein
VNLQNPIKEWENHYWVPPVMWPGETVFCLASGPSLTQEIAEKVRGRRTIVVNGTCHLAPWADILFFTDSGWYIDRKDLVANWPGLVVSLSRQAKRELDDPTVNLTGVPRILRPKMVGAPPFPPRLPGRVSGFPPPGSPEIQQGRTSGHTAITVARALGAARIVMLGYDMQVVAGREHHHDEYAGTKRDLEQYERDFVPSFAGWQEAAEADGFEIINCTPGSAVKEFPFGDLDEILNDGRP